MAGVDDDILRAAKRLDKDPAFDLIMEHLSQDAYQQFATSAPGDKEAREQAYNKHMSLVQIVVQIKSWADAAP